MAEAEAYPVVADPTITLGWKWNAGTLIYARYSKPDVRTLNQDNVSGLTNKIIGAMCPKVQWPGDEVCEAILGDRASTLKSVFTSAQKYGQCAMLITPISWTAIYYFKAYRYAC